MQATASVNHISEFFLNNFASILFVGNQPKLYVAKEGNISRQHCSYWARKNCRMMPRFLCCLANKSSICKTCIENTNVFTQTPTRPPASVYKALVCIKIWRTDRTVCTSSIVAHPTPQSHHSHGLRQDKLTECCVRRKSCKSVKKDEATIANTKNAAHIACISCIQSTAIFKVRASYKATLLAPEARYSIQVKKNAPISVMLLT